MQLEDENPVPNLSSMERLFNDRVGSRIVHLQQTTSTMDVAHELAQQSGILSDLHGTVIIADAQTQGRGRFGRIWHSNPGEDILASVILCPRPAITGNLTTMASLAAAITVDAFVPHPSKIKWPNDVIVDGKKICGVIAESVTIAEQFVGIVGIGLNVNHQPPDTPSDRYIATSIRQASASPTNLNRQEVFRTLLDNLNDLYDALDRGETIIPEWRQRLLGLGSPISVATSNPGTPRTVISGIAEDVDDFGRLIIRSPDGTLQAVAAGEVTTQTESDGR